VSRPLLAGLDAAGRAARLAELLEARQPWYAEADHLVDASGSPDEVVERIVSLLPGHGAV
jgi:shikimate kinase